MRGLFRRSFDSLDEIFAFTEQFFASESIDREHLYAVNLAVEELFTNMVKYNPAGHTRIALHLQRVDGRLLVRLLDREARPFDVSRAPAVDIDAPLEAREPGGLGLHLVRSYVDTLDYSHENGTATITFTRNLDQRHV